MRVLRQPWLQRNLTPLRFGAQSPRVYLPQRYKLVSGVFDPALNSLSTPFQPLSRPLTSSSYSPPPAMAGFYDLKAELPNGKSYEFDQLKGKVVLIVNVASKWYALSSMVSAHVAVLMMSICPRIQWIHTSVQRYGSLLTTCAGVNIVALWQVFRHSMISTKIRVL